MEYSVAVFLSVNELSFPEAARAYLYNISRYPEDCDDARK
jgi:hypothetical protein